MPPDGDLDGAVRRTDPERWLASRFIADPSARADVVALYAFDRELDRALRVTSNTLLAEIRLTWWREVVEEIFAGGQVRRHPLAQALADAVRRRGHPRERLDAMIDTRIDPPDDVFAWADGVGGSATVLAAHTLDPDVDVVAPALAGRVWGLLTQTRAGRGPIDLSGRPSPVRRRLRPWRSGRGCFWRCSEADCESVQKNAAA